MELEKIKKKREELMTNYNSLVDKRIELEKQLEVTNTDILTMRGAILLSNEFIEEEEKPEEIIKIKNKSRIPRPPDPTSDFFLSPRIRNSLSCST